MLSIGAELDQLTGPQYLSYWTDIIDAVREVFSGALTYSASWNTASEVSFWNQLNYEGIDCYVPLSNAPNPTLQQLVNGWLNPATPPQSRRLRGDRKSVADPIFRKSRAAIRQAADLHRARLRQRQRSRRGSVRIGQQSRPDAAGGALPGVLPGMGSIRQLFVDRNLFLGVGSERQHVECRAEYRQLQSAKQPRARRRPPASKRGTETIAARPSDETGRSQLAQRSKSPPPTPKL